MSLFDECKRNCKRAENCARNDQSEISVCVRGEIEEIYEELLQKELSEYREVFQLISTLQDEYEIIL